MQSYTNNVQDRQGNAIAGAQVLVLKDGAAAVIYSDNGITPATNPLTTDANGSFTFYGPTGNYSLTITSPKLPGPVEYTGIPILDPDDFDFTLRDDLASEAAGSGSELVAYTPSGTGAVPTTVQHKLREFVSVKDFGAVGDGVANDTAAVQAAVTHCFTTGDTLYWPQGTYLTTSSIANFHEVQHSGPGVLLRGANTFRFQSDFTTTNKIFVATTGSDSQDGFSASEAVQTIQRALDIWKARYAARATYQFTIDIAAGTYTTGSTLSGCKSPVELRLEGKVSGSTPTVIIDGTGSSSSVGLNFNGCSEIRVRFVDVKNFRANSATSGIAFQNGTRGVIDTCRATNNWFADFNCSEDGEMVFIGTCTAGAGSRYGMRYYRLAGGSIGDGTNPITISGTTEAGIQVRDGSFVVCQHNLTLDNCFSGLQVIKQGYCELRTTTVSNNTYGINIETQSLFDNQSGTITFSGNTTNKRIAHGSIDRSDLSSTTLIPHWLKGQNGLSGQITSSGYDVIVDNAGNTGIQFLTPGANLANIDANKTTRITFDTINNRFTLTLNNTTAYRITAASLFPANDNTISLGANGFRWSTVWAATSTIATSDSREKQQVRSLSDKERAVAVRLKSLIRAFKFNDAVEKKGEKARVHFGVIAQDVKSAFEAEGLVADDYALFCYDEWGETPEEKDDDGNITQKYLPGGNRYGVRYEELLAFIIGAM